MSFTFYDLNGNVIQRGAVQVDFTPNFVLPSPQPTRVAHFRCVSFTVTGDSRQILAADVQLTNSAERRRFST